MNTNEVSHYDSAVLQFVSENKILVVVVVIILVGLVLYAVIKNRSIEFYGLKIGSSSESKKEARKDTFVEAKTPAYPLSPEIKASLSTNAATKNVIFSDLQHPHTVARIIHSNEDRITILNQIVQDAEKSIHCTGSRSRDHAYLEAIERRLKERPNLVYCRILFGQPHHEVLKEHLVKILKLRDPLDRTFGYSTTQIGLLENIFTEPECFVCANEKMVFIKLPSLNNPSEYDTGIVYEDHNLVERMKHYVHALHLASKQINSIEEAEKLSHLRIKTKKDN